MVNIVKVSFICDKQIEYSGLTRYGRELEYALSHLLEVERIFLKYPKFFLNGAMPLSNIWQDFFIDFEGQPTGDVTHFRDQTIYSSSLLKRCKNPVVTVCDLIGFTEYNLFGHNPYLSFRELDRWYYLKKMKSIKKTKAIITISEYTKKDVVRFLDIDEDRIRVIYPGVSKSFKPGPHIKRQKFSLLYVGTEEPRKNLCALIEVLSKLKERIPEIRFVKVGRSNYRECRKMLVDLVAQHGLESNVIIKEYVHDLVREYNQADLFVYPSLYEGFGLPVLEAMACGCPVVTSNATSLPEVGDDAVRYFDPHDIDSMFDVIYEVLTNEEQKRELSERGIQRAALFNWDKTAEETFNFYKEIVEA